MISIAAKVEQLVIESEFLTEGMLRGVLNLSELARQLMPRLQKELWKPVGQAAVVMALTRLASRLQQEYSVESKPAPYSGELTTRSGLSEFTYLYSDTTYECQRRLFNIAERHTDDYVSVTQGVREVMIIASLPLVAAVEACFGNENLLVRQNHLSSLTLRLNPDTRKTPGVYHAVLKQLAWEKINILNLSCTCTELNLLLEQGQLRRAFSILSGVVE